MREYVVCRKQIDIAPNYICHVVYPPFLNHPIGGKHTGVG